MAFGPFQVIDPFSAWHRQTIQIEIVHGQVKAIEPVRTSPKGYLIPGGIDLISWTRWPVDPRAESLTSLASRLYEAGYAEAIVASSLGWTDPEMFAALTAEAQNAPIPLYLLASFWHEGQLAPIESLRAAGAWGWTLPSTQPIPWKGLVEALSYLRYVGGPVFLLPFWEALAGEIGVPQIPLLVLSGWQGTPPFVEALAIRLLAEIHRYTGGNLYIGPITTQHGLQTALQENLTPFTAFPYLFFSADRLLSYDPIWKVHPSLQDTSDQKALWQALKRGDLALVGSYHEAVPAEEKDHPWGEASAGMATLPEGAAVFFSLAEEMGLSLDRAVEVWAIYPRQKLGIAYPELAVDKPLRHVLLLPVEGVSLWRGVRVSYGVRPLRAEYLDS